MKRERECLSIKYIYIFNVDFARKFFIFHIDFIIIYYNNFTTYSLTEIKIHFASEINMFIIRYYKNWSLFKCIIVYQFSRFATFYLLKNRQFWYITSKLQFVCRILLLFVFEDLLLPFRSSFLNLFFIVIIFYYFIFFQLAVSIYVL